MSRRAIWLTLLSMALTAVIWAVRLEGRVNTVTDKHQELTERVYEELRYIRGRVDKLAEERR